MLELLQQAVARKVAVECRYYTIVRDSEAMRVIEPQSVQVRLEFPASRWVSCANVSRRCTRDPDVVALPTLPPYPGIPVSRFPGHHTHSPHRPSSSSIVSHRPTWDLMVVSDRLDHD